MTGAWRPLALAAALNVIACVGVAAAQTVIATGAPPGSTIELAMNDATAGSAAADAGGRATLALNLSALIGKAETDVRVFVDVCDAVRRVVLVEQGLQPAPRGAGCDRKEIIGLFVVRKTTTLVVSLAGPSPTMWLRQGRVPAEWLTQGGPEETGSASTRRPSPTGLVVFGGAGFVKFRDAVAVSCGNVSECVGDENGIAYTAGAAYWFTRYLGAEASYLKPANVTVNGSGTNFRFNSSLDAHVLTVAGNVGIPIGPVRFYGKVGGNYHRATSSTTQTVDDTTVTVDNVTQTIAGGTQTFELRTSGWGWLFGGGVEGWVTRSLAIFGEVGRARLKGTNFDVGEGDIDDRVTFVRFGVRFHIGR